MAIFFLLALGLVVPLMAGEDSEQTGNDSADQSDLLPNETPDTTETGDGTSPLDYISGSDTPDGFNIEIEMRDEWTNEQQQAIIDASERLSDIVLGDIPQTIDPTTGELIDDLKINVILDNFDDQETGTNSILGQARILHERFDSQLPSVAEIRLSNQMDIETFRSTALHEMLHALGLGFNAFDDDVREVGNVTRFTGVNATQAYLADTNLSGSDPNAAQGVPLDHSHHHWDEDTLLNELMTPINSSDTEFLSTVTVAALEDMGYDTIWDDIRRSHDATGQLPLNARLPLSA